MVDEENQSDVIPSGAQKVQKGVKDAMKWLDSVEDEVFFATNSLLSILFILDIIESH